jgi:release factor glutamine methyltransferase
MRVDPGVFEPTEGSFLIWKHLYRSGAGQDRRCLDVGCGCGILAVQLAKNGARHVHAIDVQQEATANTMANAFRNGVSEQVVAEAEDLYTFSSSQTYDLIVSSLYQVPVDPYGEITGHRPVDFWGRNLLDHLISILPDLLAPGGVAYLMQLSILSQTQTAELLDQSGLVGKVIDFDTFGFSPIFMENIEQIRQVEQLSDAYHLTIEKTEVMVAYLLQITHKSHAPA